MTYTCSWEGGRFAGFWFRYIIIFARYNNTNLTSAVHLARVKLCSSYDGMTRQTTAASIRHKTLSFQRNLIRKEYKDELIQSPKDL